MRDTTCALNVAMWRIPCKHRAVYRGCSRCNEVGIEAAVCRCSTQGPGVPQATGLTGAIWG